MLCFSDSVRPTVSVKMSSPGQSEVRRHGDSPFCCACSHDSRANNTEDTGITGTTEGPCRSSGFELLSTLDLVGVEVPARWWIGTILSLAVALGAWRVGALTRSGATAAAVVGILVVAFGGWPMAALLVLFFVTSSAWTRWHAPQKSHPEHSHGRSAVQVWANGTIAAGLAVWSGLVPAPWIGTAFAAAIAAATADTWATELGLLSSRPPRMITSGRLVAPGQSGGVTVLGTLGGIVGAAVIGVAAVWGLRVPFVPVWVGGSLAMAIDSVLGATIEGRARWLDNNAVNFLTTAAGALVGTALASW